MGAMFKAIKKLLVLLLVTLLPATSVADDGIALIRDSEVEHTLKSYADPIFRVAGLNADGIHIYIVNDPELNAFVAGGQNLFLNTGMILECKNANMLIGVMAHETGHMAGGHLVKMGNQMKDVSAEAILGMVLGAAVTVAGLPEAGVAVMAGSQHVAERNFLSFSREQEVEADQYGVNFLHRTGQSTQGMLDVMELLRRHETLSYGAVDPFAISHPLSQDRIALIRSQTSTETNIKDDGFDAMHQRMVAKLYGFLEKPEYTLSKYTGDTIPDHYARAIAYYKQPNLTKALKEIDTLIALKPNDPFFNELKGQFLAESGRPREALVLYQKADQLFPNDYLLKLELGKLYISVNDLDSAINQLNKASKIEFDSSEVWRQLAVAYGTKGDSAMANLMLAEESKRQNKNPEAKKYAKVAAEGLPKNSPALQRANDIIADIKIEDKKKDKDED